MIAIFVRSKRNKMKAFTEKEAKEQAKKNSKNGTWWHVVCKDGEFYIERGALPELAENEILIGIYKNGIKCN